MKPAATPAATGTSQASEHTLKTGYRPDIDGLRAIAVLSVLFYHARLPPFSGGFVGVDIFFVISGYLITGIILADIAEGRFSVAHFYERRVRRIFPALYLTVGVTLVGAFALFTAVDLERLFDSLAWLALFASNFYFAENSGYFDAAAEQNAILQTWSLAIEEQFYIVFPLLLALLGRQRRVPTKWIVLGLAIVSLVFSIYIVDRDARSAFFSTSGRVWELMLGALATVGLYPRLDHPGIRSAISAIGLVLVAGSLVFLTTETPFPGAYALPACLGTVAIIWAGSCGTTPVTRWLSWRPLVFVGLLSYSLYLLHWPLLTFARYWNQGELSAAQTALALAAAFLGAWLSWRYVETPFRKPRAPMPRRALFAVAVSLMLALGVGSFAAAQWQSGQYSVAEKVIAAEEARARAERCLIEDLETFEDWKSRSCTFDGVGKRIAVWGDSFASHYFEAFRDLAAENQRSITLLARGSCPPIVGLSIPNRPGCEDFNKQAIALLLAQRPEVVVISADWIIYEKKKTVAEMAVDKYALLEETIAKLRTGGSQVLVIGPSPMFPVPVARIAAGTNKPTVAATGKASYSRKYDDFFRALEARRAIQYLPAYEVFCNAAAYCMYRDEAALLFWDTGHLTARGGARVVTRLVEKFPDLFKRHAEDGNRR